MTGWQGVLDQQLDLHHFWRSDAGRRSAIGFGKSMMRVESEAHPGYEDVVEDLITQLDETEATKLYSADTFYVDPDMMTVVEKAAETFEPEPLRATDLITPGGFVVLPRPFSTLDRHNKVVSIRAFSWMPCVERKDFGATQLIEEEDSYGVHLSLYSHIDDFTDPASDGYAEEYAERFESMRAAHERYGTPYALAHFTVWGFGDPLPEEAGGWAGWWVPIQAFFRLTLQTVGDRYNQQPDRAARKRADRVLMPKKDRYVTVIRLRRPKAKHDDEPAHVDWQHRWLVGGHWRNQWYPAVGEHRQIWIAPYVKGPDDKPLLIRKGRAFELVR